MNEIRDRRIIKKIIKKDENGIIDLVDIYGGLLKSIISKKLSFLPDEIDEVMNDTLLKIWSNIEYFDPSKGTFKNWICAIGTFQAIDKVRKVYDKSLTLPLDEGIVSQDTNLDENLLRDELYAQLLDLINTLKYPDSEIFLDLFFNDLSYEEVSKKYGIKISNLYTIVSRGRKKLRQAYKEENNEWKKHIWNFK